MIWKEVILIFAAWRITSLLVDEDGPFDILAKFRRLAGVYYDEFNNRQGKNVVAKAMTCVWCFSVWIAAATAFLSDNVTNVRTYVIEVFWLSACIILLNEVINRIGER